jgi:hypothetical protein
VPHSTLIPTTYITEIHSCISWIKHIDGRHNLLGWQHFHHLTQMCVVDMFGVVMEISIFGVSLHVKCNWSYI